MRAFSVCLALVLLVGILVGASGNPVGDDTIVAVEAADKPLSLIDADGRQGHENEGDRVARHNGYGGYHGGHHGSYGHGGGYGGHHGGHGGHRGGYHG